MKKRLCPRSDETSASGGLRSIGSAGGLNEGLAQRRHPSDDPNAVVSCTVMPDLHPMLEQYAARYAETYGRKEPVSELVPAMPTAFQESDRNFVRTRVAK